MDYTNDQMKEILDIRGKFLKKEKNKKYVQLFGTFKGKKIYIHKLHGSIIDDPVFNSIT